MFSLHDIDARIEILESTASDLDDKADERNPGLNPVVLHAYAQGLREGSGLLRRMIENAIEDQAREAMTQ